MGATSDRPSVWNHVLAGLVVALIAMALFFIAGTVMAAMWGIVWLSHKHLTLLPYWVKGAALLLGFGLTVWTTWILDPVVNRSWREQSLRVSAWPAYAVFSGSLSLVFEDGPRLQIAAPYVIFLFLALFDLSFRFEPRVLRLRDRLRGEASDE